MSTDQHLDETIRQAYRAAAQEEPGSQLDARILQAAHTALITPARKSARWSWLVLPFSAAAIAIMVTTLILQLRQTSSTPPGQSASAPSPQAAKPQVAASSHDTKKNQAAQMASAEEALSEQRHRESGKSEKLAAAETQTKQKADLKIAAAPALARSLESAPQPAPSVNPQLADSTPEGAAVSGTLRPSPAAAAPAAKRAETSTDQLAEAEPRPAREPKLQAYSTPTKARSQDNPTEKQLEDIRKLQHEGKLDAAKKVLAELRKQFPQFKVPEDLRGLIEPNTDGEKKQP